MSKNSENESVMYVRLGPYLYDLTLAEQSKPAHLRRPVPEMKEIASAIGIGTDTLSNLVTGKTQSLKLKIGKGIIDEMRRRGFDMQITDLITYIPEKNNN